MSYFQYIPKTTYEFNGVSHTVTDILRRATFISEYKPLTDLFISYTIFDGETPQMLANKFYASVNHYWVILLFNELHNPYFDWPLDSIELREMCIDKYTTEYMGATKHYEYNGNIVGEIKEFSLDTPWIVPEFPGFGTAVTFYNHETILNDKKREINILKPALLGNFVSQFESAING